jgi:broad specificity phosphatase PhoE
LLNIVSIKPNEGLELKKEIYIFRHGETNWIIDRVLEGHLDMHLNQKGREQSIQLSVKLEKLNLDVLLSSDLSRAYETAQLSTKNLGIEIIKNKALREAHIGEAEILSLDEITKKYGELSWKRWCSVRKEDLDFSFPKGESKKQQLNRTKEFLEDFLLSTSHLRIGVTAHSGVIRSLCHFSNECPDTPLPVPNCVVYKLVFNGKDWLFVGAA